MSFPMIRHDWIKNKSVLISDKTPNIVVGPMVISDRKDANRVFEKELANTIINMDPGFYWGTSDCLGAVDKLDLAVMKVINHARLYDPIGDGIPIIRPTSDNMTFELMVKPMWGHVSHVCSVEFAFSILLKDAPFLSLAKREESLLPTVVVTKFEPKIGRVIMWQDVVYALDCLAEYGEKRDGS